MEELKAQVYNVMNRTLKQKNPKQQQAAWWTEKHRQTISYRCRNCLVRPYMYVLAPQPERAAWEQLVWAWELRLCNTAELQAQQRLHVHNPQFHSSSVLSLGMGCTELIWVFHPISQWLTSFSKQLLCCWFFFFPLTFLHLVQQWGWIFLLGFELLL